MGQQTEVFTVDPEMELLSKIRVEKPEHYKKLSAFQKLSLGYYL